MDPLIAKLEEATRATGKGKALRREFAVANHHSKLTSWRFNEWDYGKPKIKLPCNARGLFTMDGRIVVRGYDKFFSVDEVASTRWSSIESDTQGPYTVTVKENGCIILVSGLEDGTLVVCSKHSYGSRQDINRNHAAAGEEFLCQQLQAHGVEPRELALWLHDQNVTAVAEYCDDSFEEHVVEYSREHAGMYLHGINSNEAAFRTMPMPQVREVADKYGFRAVDYFTVESVGELKATLETFAKTGMYKGRETEGFVIRCHRGGDDFLFKFKFEEPYLMYRQWREVTKSYISDGVRKNVTKHREITKRYLDFVIPLLDGDKLMRERYMNGHGIIELRNRFLESSGMTASDIIDNEALRELDMAALMETMKIDGHTKFVLVPVATIGCGKSTVGLILKELFPNWSMISNDDIPKGKNGATQFVKRGLELLKTHSVVIMDRNNHQIRERQQLFETFNKLSQDYLQPEENLQFVALNFIPSGVDISKVRSVTMERVMERGDNHQSIKAHSDSNLAQKIMNGFLSRFQPIDVNGVDSSFDLVIDLNPLDPEGSIKNAITVLKRLQEKYPLLVDTIPPIEDFRRAYAKAREFKTTLDKFKVETPVMYYSLDIPMGPVIRAIESSVPNDCTYWTLKAQGLIQKEFHVTCAHIAQRKKFSKQWKLYGQVKGDVRASITLSRIIWNKDIVTVLVEDVKFKDHDELQVLNEFPHITIGCSDNVKPVYSNTLALEYSKGLVSNCELPRITLEAVLKSN